LLIISTSIIGSFLLFSGIDYWVQSGFGNLLYKAIQSNGQDGMQGIEGRSVYVFAGFVVVALGGMVGQYSHDRKMKSKNDGFEKV
jgi:hypothetical protein